MTKQELTHHLTIQIEQIIARVEKEFVPLDSEKLNWKESAERWSILECFEHLNRYNRHYNWALEKGIINQATNNPPLYKSKWLGRIFIRMMDPKNGKKQKTMRHLNPAGSHLDKETIFEFIRHQKHLLQLTEKLPQVNPNARVIPVEFMRILKLSIGDAFTFVITHQQRHLLQAETALEKQRWQHADLIV